MSTALTTISVDQIPDLLAEINEAFKDIPFENSEFQTRAFVIAAQQTPARAYRAIGLRMHAKIQAVEEYMYQQELNKVNIEEMESKLADPDVNEFEKRRLRLEIIKLGRGQEYGKKLLGDCIAELNVLYDEFKKLPRYTRETFEAEERKHFLLKLDRQIKAPGPHESLANMHVDMPQWDKRIEESVAMLASLEDFKKRFPNAN